ncbi:MAG: AbrB family transcriptional regulator [Thermoproteota archaeon]
MTEIVRIDSRGRVTLPSSLREGLKLSEGMYVMLIGDLDKKQVRIVPFAHPEARLMEFQIIFSDIPGALAKIAETLAGENIDLLSSESRTLRRGKSAEWIIIADVSDCKCELQNLKEKLIKEGVAEQVKFRSFP